MTTGWTAETIKTAPKWVEEDYRAGVASGEIGSIIKIGGIYDHFKGGIYLVGQLATSVDTDEKMVVYCSLLYGTWHVRRASQWNEAVLWPDNKLRSRFVLRDPPEIVPAFKVAR